MIEDMTHLGVFDAHMHEVQAVIEAHNRETNGLKDKAELARLRLEFIAVLTETLRQQRRAVDHMMGRPVEPESHYAEAILLGVLGGESA